MAKIIFVFLSFLFFPFILAHQGAHHLVKHDVFQIGTDLEIECKDPNGNWGPGPVCKETGKSISFPFGIEGFFHCSIEIDTAMYDYFKRILNLETNWMCRVPITLDKHNYLPFAIPLWGVVEENHCHINGHMNFIFHVDRGFILGAAAYPVHDPFHMVRDGGQFGLHGPTRWFKGHSFNALSSNVPEPSGESSNSSSIISSYSSIFLYSTLSFLFTLLVSIIFYKKLLKPRLIRKHLKQD